MSRQGRHGLSSHPGLFASSSITPSILLARLSFILRHAASFSFYPVIYIVRSAPRRLFLPSLGCVSRAARDEKQRCRTRNSEAQKPGFDLKFCHRQGKMKYLLFKESTSDLQTA